MSQAHDKLEARITELESRLAFQDRTIEELHQVLYRQQGEIDRLQRELELLRPRLQLHPRRQLLAKVSPA